MTTIDTTGKVGYMYDQETDTWYALSGAVNTNAAYTWTATQTFGNTATFQSALNAKGGVNNFLSTAERDSVIVLLEIYSNCSIIGMEPGDGLMMQHSYLQKPQTIS
jgi:hypothetical protein